MAGLRVPDHKGRATARQQLQRIGIGAARGRCRHHLLHDHRALRDRRLFRRSAGRVVGPVFLQPPVKIRRVPNHDWRMGTVVGALPFPIHQRVDVGARVAHMFVVHPAGRLVPVTEGTEVFAQFLLVLVKRQTAWVANDWLQRLAQGQIGRNKGLALQVRALAFG